MKSAGLRQFKGSRIQLVILSSLLYQLLMAAPLDDPSLLQYHNHIGILNGRQPVSDDKYCPPLHQMIHAFLNNSLRTGIMNV